MEWQSKKLIDISQVSTGKWDANHATEAGNYKFFTCAYDSFLCDTKRFEGECLILPGNGVNVGEVFYYAGEFDAYQRTYVISDIQINSKYLFYHMKCFWKQRNLNKQYGSATNYLKIGNFNDYEVSFPPIPEQKRIVALLDTVFADLEQTRAKTEQNLKNARELFDSYLQQVFSQKGKGCEQVSLSKITESISDGDHSAPPKSDEGIPFITISNINKKTLEIDFSNTFKVPEEYYSALKPNRKPKAGDVLYTVTGSYGIPVIVKENKDFCFQRHIGLIRPNNETNSQWLYYLLMSPQVFNQADSGATGTAQKTVSLTLLRSILVPNIPLNIQKEMVQGLDHIYEKSKALEAIYQKKLISIDELKKSILQKAFSGELTTTAN
jgi:type I restriction enzyme S subunit